MKSRSLCLYLFCVFCVFAFNAFALDREAFTFTSYDLNVRVEPGQQRLAVRGKIILRNDSSAPQKTAVLQISSSLNWLSIKAGGKPLQFTSQPYDSDIDHTGALSEAIVTLPDAVPHKGTLELEIAYEGVVIIDATRLTRIGTPDSIANSTDWDQIGTAFTAVRGAGYVTWYPIATEDASLADGSLTEVLGRWKVRASASTVHVKINVSRDDGEHPRELVVNEASCLVLYEAMGRAQLVSANCTYQPLGLVVPTFIMAKFALANRPAIDIHYLNGHDASATAYADAAEKVIPFITEWFGTPRSKASTIDLADPNSAPFESGPLLLTALSGIDSKLAGITAAHQLTHAAFSSPRPWINEGLAHFAQAIYLEHQSGRQAALDYMALHSSALIVSEKDKQTAMPRSEDETNHSLINTHDEELYRSKAMCVWWMLREMIGDPALKRALVSYHADQDKEPAYMQHLIQAQTQRDLEWFFDDWVNRDRGLPDFKVASAFARKTSPDNYMLTVTVENLGMAGAEVPVTIKFAGGVIVKRLMVRGKNNAVVRVEVPNQPEEIVVNDGSVPESDTTNNVFKIEISSDTK
jgi:hypothetical protein